MKNVIEECNAELGRMQKRHAPVIILAKGKSAVVAAYRAGGEKIINEFDGETHDYTHKGGVVHTEILLSENAPPNMQTAPFCGTP